MKRSKSATDPARCARRSVDGRCLALEFGGSCDPWFQWMTNLRPRGGMLCVTCVLLLPVVSRREKSTCVLQSGERRPTTLVQVHVLVGPIFCFTTLAVLALNKGCRHSRCGLVDQMDPCTGSLAHCSLPKSTPDKTQNSQDDALSEALP